MHRWYSGAKQELFCHTLTAGQDPAIARGSMFYDWSTDLCVVATMSRGVTNQQLSS